MIKTMNKLGYINTVKINLTFSYFFLHFYRRKHVKKVKKNLKLYMWLTFYFYCTALV